MCVWIYCRVVPELHQAGFLMFISAVLSFLYLQYRLWDNINLNIEKSEIQDGAHRSFLSVFGNLFRKFWQSVSLEEEQLSLGFAGDTRHFELATCQCMCRIPALLRTRRMYCRTELSYASLGTHYIYALSFQHLCVKRIPQLRGKKQSAPMWTKLNVQILLCCVFFSWFSLTVKSFMPTCLPYMSTV